MEAIIFIGIQAAGKSSFYRERFFHSHVRINLDMLRTRNRERVLMRACLETKQPFVIDNTNVRAEERALYIEAAKAAGFRVVGYYFPSKVADALRRNSVRTGRQHVPPKGLLGTYKRLQEPTYSEGFDRLYHVVIGTAGEFIVSERADAPR